MTGSEGQERFEQELVHSRKALSNSAILVLSFST